MRTLTNAHVAGGVEVWKVGFISSVDVALKGTMHTLTFKWTMTVAKMPMTTLSPQILTPEECRAERDKLDLEGKKLVFTNGCFDILHRGHVTYLGFAREQGDALVVGVNSDSSVRRNKGEHRPINSEEDRGYVLGSLKAVDYIVLFDEDEPRDLIAKILPHVLVKGRDWAHYVSGREVVEANGGKVVLADMVAGKSTTGTIEKVLKAYAADGNRGD